MPPSRTDEAGPQADTTEDILDEDLLSPSNGESGEAGETQERDDAGESSLSAWRAKTAESDDEPRDDDEVEDGEAVDELDDVDQGRADEDDSSETGTPDTDEEPANDDEEPEDGLIDLEIEEDSASVDPFGKVPDDEWEKYDDAAKARVSAQRAEAKQLRQQISELEGLREHADYGREVLEFAQQHQIESLEPWLNLAATSRTNPQKAGAMLVAAAERLGYQAPTPQLPEALQAEVDAGNMDEDQAFEMAAKLGISTTPEPVEAPDIAPPLDPSKRQLSEATSALQNVAQEFRGKLNSKSFEYAHTKVTTQLKAAANNGELGPESWAFFYRQGMDNLIAAQKRKPKSLGKQSRSTTSARSGKKPAKKPESPVATWRKNTGRRRR